MNERIKELAEQAWTLVSTEERDRGELYEADQQRERREEVFAELIVKECLTTITDQATWDTNEDFREGFSHGRKLAWQEIRNKFGVK